MKFMPGKRGFSIVEAVLGTAIISACFLSLVSIMTDTTLTNIKIDFIATSVLLARDKVSEVMAKNFDSVASEAKQDFSGNFSNYNYTVTVNYVNQANPDVAVAGPTDLKKVDVAVSFTDRPDTVHIYDLKVKIQ